MAELKQYTWVVVTDSEKALFLRNLTDAQDPDLDLMSKEEQDNPSDLDQSANRPGRMHDGGPAQRSAMDDTDWHELAKERFAKQLAEILYDHAHQGDFRHLVIVAAPQVLGDLRPELHTEVADKVIAEIPKNLAGTPIDKIEALVRKEVKAA